MQKIALLFPGQGSQYVGMGQDFYEQTGIGSKVFERFEKILKRDLSRLCFRGPEDELKLTINAQPAIAAVSMTAFSLFKEKYDIKPAFVAGHSLGEYTSLYASGVVSLDDLVVLIDFRSKFMQTAKKGCMSAIMNLGEERIQSILQEASHFGTVVIANYNSPTQIVISGDEAAINFASRSAKEAGAIVLPVTVSGAFHSPLMDGFMKPFKALLDKINFNNASFPVVTNVDAVPTSNGQDFKMKLVKQLSSPVLWRRSIELMVNKGVNTFIELGPQQALSKLLRRWLPGMNIYSVYDLPSLESTLDLLQR